MEYQCCYSCVSLESFVFTSGNYILKYFLIKTGMVVTKVDVHIVLVKPRPTGRMREGQSFPENEILKIFCKKN